MRTTAPAVGRAGSTAPASPPWPSGRADVGPGRGGARCRSHRPGERRYPRRWPEAVGRRDRGPALAPRQRRATSGPASRTSAGPGGAAAAAAGRPPPRAGAPRDDALGTPPPETAPPPRPASVLVEPEGRVAA